MSEPVNHDPDRRPVVVGVDGTAGSRAALAFALEEGLARGVTVEVVTTWLLGPALSDIAVPSTFEEEQAKAERCQEVALAAVMPDLQRQPVVSRVVLHSYGGHALVDAAHDAAMLVVGSGRKRLLARALLGSVSEYCVRHATVPVVVVPDPSRVQDDAIEEEIVPVGAIGAIG